MILSDVLGSQVVDDAGTWLGRIIDARFVLEGVPASEAALAPARLVGFLVSPHARGSYLGYERRRLTAPWPVGRLMAWRHRGSFLVAWADVHSLGGGTMRLRPGYTRNDPALP